MGGRRFDLRSLEDASQHWEIQNVIGEGTYGLVYRGVSKKKPTQEAAIKIIENALNKTDDVQVELSILKRKSNHENIASFYGAYIRKEKRGAEQLWIAMELCDGGPVSDFAKRLTRTGARMDERVIAYILAESMKGIHHLHSHRVIHRDIKGPNILMTLNGDIKLIDFGISADLKHSLMRRHSSVGSPFWMAPEVIACEQQLEYTYDKRCDVWSLGITAIELADGEPPLADQHPMRALFKIPRNPSPTVKRPDKWSREYIDFMSRCLVKDFEERPDIKELICHPFVAGVPDERPMLKKQLIRLLTSRTKQNEEELRDQQEEARMKQRMTGEVLDKRRAYSMLDIENLATLDTLTDDTILGHLLERYAANRIYTYIGDILIAMNPFKELDIYTDADVDFYKETKEEKGPPHIFAIASNAYRLMTQKKKDQCIIISGESGSGKTVSHNHVVRQLAELGKTKNRSLVKKILQVNPLMEAFGNAKTVINSNSSRFGKYLELVFKPNGVLVGAQLTEYLLEKTRVVGQPRAERNFHMLYYLIAGLDYHRRLGHFDLSTSDRHRYLNTDHLSLDEAACTPEMQHHFAGVQKCFDVIGFTHEEVQSLYCVLAAVIHIGDIRFSLDETVIHEGEKSKVVNMDSLKTVASLLCVKVNELRDALTTNSNVTRGETIIRHNSMQQATDCRDAMAKGLYGRLFSWIVKRINALLRSDESHSEGSIKIGILDIFGFENFFQNSFEQLCINIANEQLQFYFNQYVFEWENEEYVQEGIDLKAIRFENNRPLLELFLQKPLGLLALLDEESRFPKASDVTLVEKFSNNLSAKYFYKRGGSSTTFSVQHYAAKVSYDASGFLEKNRDTLSQDILNVLRISDDKLVRTLFQGMLDAQGRLTSLPRPEGHAAQWKGTANSAQSFFINYGGSTESRLDTDGKSNSNVSSNKLQGTVSTHFRNSLRTLMSKMIRCDAHYVRCIRPNTDNLPVQFDQEKVMTQLRYTGVLETTKIRQQGYPERVPIEEFATRYQFIAYEMHKDIPKTKDNCVRILRAAKLDDEWRIGHSKVFLKYYHLSTLTVALERYRLAILRIQKFFRATISMRKSKEDKVLREDSAIMIQRNFRGFIARKKCKRLIEEREREHRQLSTKQYEFTDDGVVYSEARRPFGTIYRDYVANNDSQTESVPRERFSDHPDIDRSKITGVTNDPVAAARLEKRQALDLESNASMEETRMIYFLSQVAATSEEILPAVARTAYPVLESERNRYSSEKSSRRDVDARERVVHVLHGGGDPLRRASRPNDYNIPKEKLDVIADTAMDFKDVQRAPVRRQSSLSNSPRSSYDSLSEVSFDPQRTYDNPRLVTDSKVERFTGHAPVRNRSAMSTYTDDDEFDWFSPNRVSRGGVMKRRPPDAVNEEYRLPRVHRKIQPLNSSLIPPEGKLPVERDTKTPVNSHVPYNYVTGAQLKAPAPPGRKQGLRRDSDSSSSPVEENTTRPYKYADYPMDIKLRKIDDRENELKPKPYQPSIPPPQHKSNPAPLSPHFVPQFNRRRDFDPPPKPISPSLRPIVQSRKISPSSKNPVINGFDYGVNRNSDGLLQNFQLRKTGRLEALVDV